MCPVYAFVTKSDMICYLRLYKKKIKKKERKKENAT